MLLRGACPARNHQKDCSICTPCLDATVTMESKPDLILVIERKAAAGGRSLNGIRSCLDRLRPEAPQPAMPTVRPANVSGEPAIDLARPRGRDACLNTDLADRLRSKLCPKSVPPLLPSLFAGPLNGHFFALTAVR